MLVIALQFYTGDWYRTMKLARFLRELEERRRDDVALLFVRTSEVSVSRLVDEVIARCSEVFHVESVVLRPDTPERTARWGLLGRWPVGCNVLWQGAVEYFLRGMNPSWSTLFTVDGGDSAPLCRDWVDVLVADHAETLRRGLSVTGWVGKDGLGRWHANLNCLFERTFFEKHPGMLDMPSGADMYEPVDMHRASTILSACRASSVVRSSWRMVGLRPEYFSSVADASAWWHGCKDGDFVDKARDFVATSPRGARPVVVDFGPAPDLVAAGGSP